MRNEDGQGLPIENVTVDGIVAASATVTGIVIATTVTVIAIVKRERIVTGKGREEGRENRPVHPIKWTLRRRALRARKGKMNNLLPFL
jgi:hypothetical protein